MTARKRRSFSKAQIARYWFEYQVERGEIAPWSSHGWDYGEPACMAGGWWKAGWDGPHTPTGRWNATSLQKCHVVPLFKGGADDLSNLVLMCENCHAMQPDSTDPDITYAYMRTRSLWDCLGVSGVITSGLLDIASGADADIVTDDTIRKAREVMGV